MPVDCKHDPVYYGVINLNDDDVPVGAVDVWRCRKCKRTYVEEKRYGDPKVSTSIGLNEIQPEDAEWGILTCAGKQYTGWKVLPVKPGEVISHKCSAKENVGLAVQDDLSLAALKGSPEGIDHKLYRVDVYVNKAIDIRPSREATSTLE